LLTAIFAPPLVIGLNRSRGRALRQPALRFTAFRVRLDLLDERAK
jgi:hypothetical protein